MNKIVVPSSYNYIGVFLTFRCNMNCDYCINKYGDFKPRKEMPEADWVEGLSRIETREDLPLSLQGGEPTMHPDFYDISNSLHTRNKVLDLLTNGNFDVYEFMDWVPSRVFKRKAPYASIRFSLHTKTKSVGLVSKVLTMRDNNYSVGIWGLKCSENERKNNMVRICCESTKLDYREKEYLDGTHGTYKYPEYMTGIIDKCLCEPTEMLIAPDGKLFRCHRDLYADTNSYGHILNAMIEVPEGFQKCIKPKCNPCDVKIKTNRLQEGGHTSVTIMPIPREACPLKGGREA